MEFAAKAGKRVSKSTNNVVAKSVQAAGKATEKASAKVGAAGAGKGGKLVANAGSKVGKKAANIAVDVSYLATKALVKTLKAIIKFLDFLVAAGFVTMGIAIALILILVVSLLTGAGAVTALAETVLGDKVTTGTSTTPKPGGNGKPEAGGGTDSSGSKPNEALKEGEVHPSMDAADWAKSSEIGRQTAFWAIEAIQNGANGQKLRYRQGNTPIGWYDCMVFATGSLANSGYTLGGTNISDGKNNRYKYPYNVDKHKKSDLFIPGSTSMFLASVKGGSAKAKILFDPPNGPGSWTEKLVAGDMLLMPGHIAVYLGKNKDGKPMMSHAASPRSTGGGDVLMKSKGTQVVFQELDVYLKYEKRNIVVLRPSDFVK